MVLLGASCVFAGCVGQGEPADDEPEAIGSAEQRFLASSPNPVWFSDAASFEAFKGKRAR